MKNKDKKHNNILLYVVIGLLLVAFVIVIVFIIKDYKEKSPVPIKENSEESVPAKDDLSNKDKIDNVIFGTITFFIDDQEYLIRDYAIKNNIQFSYYIVYDIDRDGIDELIIRENDSNTYYVFKCIVDKVYGYKLEDIKIYDNGIYYDMNNKIYYEIISVTDTDIVANKKAYEMDGNYYISDEVVEKSDYDSYTKKLIKSLSMKYYPYSYN